MDFVERLRFIRGNLTQEEFAKKMDSNRRTVQEYEISDRRPNTDMLLKLHKSFSVNIHWLLTGEGIPYSAEKTVDMVVSIQNCARELEKENAAQKQEITIRRHSR